MISPNPCSSTTTKCFPLRLCFSSQIRLTLAEAKGHFFILIAIHINRNLLLNCLVKDEQRTSWHKPLPKHNGLILIAPLKLSVTASWPPLFFSEVPIFFVGFSIVWLDLERLFIALFRCSHTANALQWFASTPHALEMLKFQNKTGPPALTWDVYYY